MRRILWFIAFILIIIWLSAFLGMGFGLRLDNYVHILLAIAIVIIVYNVVTSKRPKKRSKNMDDIKQRHVKFIGILFVLIGVYLMVFSGFRIQQVDEVTEAGIVKKHNTRHKTIRWPRYLGGVFVIGGLVIVTSRMQKKH